MNRRQHRAEKRQGRLVTQGRSLSAQGIFIDAVRHHQARRLDEAAACYGRVLALEPKHPEAHNNLGVALMDLGRLGEAVTHFGQALVFRSDYPEAHNNLGVALKNQGRVDEAVACYRRALALKPDYPEAHNNLGVALKSQGRVDEAVACYGRALALKPDYPEAHNNLGVAPMRPFLLAGSSSLAVSAFVGTASAQNYTYVPYVNSSPAVDGQFDPTGFVQNDYLGSPSGLYAGRLQSDGNFVVSYGTTPNTSLFWAAGYSNPNNGPYGLSVYRGNTLTNPDSLTSYAVFSPTGQFYQLVGSNYYNGPSFLQLNDNGTLSIYPGTNGMATGDEITTVGAPAVNLQSIALTSVDYDTNAATLSNLAPVASAGVTNPNNTGTTVTFGSTLSYTYTSTQTFDFSTSSATAISISGSNQVDIFGIENTSLSVGVTETGTISHGQSTSSGESTTFTVSADVPVPPGCSYTTALQATEGTTTVPYTYTGIATYENGQTAPVSGTGVFTGENTGNFQVGTDVTPGTSCPPDSTDPPSTVAELASLSPNTVAELASFSPSTVPEPASLALLGTGVLGLAVARRRQRATVALKVPGRGGPSDT